MSIVTKNTFGKDVLAIIENGIVIDQELPKWVNAAKEIKERREKKKSDGDYPGVKGTYYSETLNSGTSTILTNATTNFIVYDTPEHYEVKDDVKFDEIAEASLKELTILIKNGALNNVLSGYGGMHGGQNWTSGNFVIGETGITPVKGGFFSKLARKISNFFNKPEFDATAFFYNVKFESKEAAETYRDRVSMYLKAIHNAKMVGQKALVEKLLGEMIANKYESMLYTKGCYYAIPEEKVVEFANKTERGVKITYIKNFTRPIPEDVINKLGDVNEYEVFDNYVIMHYDPKNEQAEETKREEAKRKDPILFGLIAGSRKLYYIADWIDEYCDLTLEKFVETLGTEKDEFLVGEKPMEVEKVEKTPKRKVKKEVAKKELKKRKTKTEN